MGLLIQSSSFSFPAEVDLEPDLPFPQSDKIQYLTESLQRITSDLNKVLALLSTFSNQQPSGFSPTQEAGIPPLPKDGIPLAAYISLAHAHSASPFVPSAAGMPLADRWLWSTGLGPRLATSSGQAVDGILAEKWHKYFPGEKLWGILFTWNPSRAPSHVLIRKKENSLATGGLWAGLVSMHRISGHAGGGVMTTPVL